MELVGQRILIVDDEPLFLQTTYQLLQKEGAVCQTAVDAATALAALEKQEFDLILTDLNMPGNLRWELLQAGRQQWAHVPMIVITGVPSLPSAIESLRLGVTDYLLKPVAFPELLASIRRALAARSDRERSESPADSGLPAAVQVTEILVGTSPIMREITNMIGRIAESSAHVLISGETGTGKELVARTIHRLSSRRDRSFQVIDCNTVIVDQLASDLFGVVGSGVEAQPGLLVQASGGCMFLDEVAELPLSFQPKLLRVVQNQEFVPIGSQTPRRVDIRFISSTQGCMETAVASGRFRQDLYYRLGVLSLVLPPLRERGEDVLELADHFWNSAQPASGRPLRLSAAARQALLAYAWPGNVRELRNVIERVATLSNKSEIEVVDLPPEIGRARERKSSTAGSSANPLDSAEGSFLDLGQNLADATFQERRAELERAYLVELMESSKGNVTQAARTANMSRQGFHKLLKRHNLSAADFRSLGERK